MKANSKKAQPNEHDKIIFSPGGTPIGKIIFSCDDWKSKKRFLGIFGGREARKRRPFFIR